LSIDFSPVQSWQHHMTIGRNQTNLQLLPYAPAFTYYNDTLYATQVRTGERTTVDYNTTWMSRWGSLLSSNLTIGANGSSGEQVYVNGCLANKETSAYINCSGAA